MKSIRLGLVCLLLVCGARTFAEGDPGAPAEAIEHWRAQRFGMFIHWGPVSLTGHEIGWSRGSQTPIDAYDQLYTRFNPTNFDADAWVAVAKKAGMRYMVLTTKHHDGFCLWDTKQTDHNIMFSPFKRDVVKELSEACKRGGIKFGTYYSTCDWHHPAFPRGSPGGKIKKPNPDLEAYTAYLEKQSTELIQNYGPLFTLWYDVPQEFDKARGERVLKLIRGLQPDIVVNNRTGAPGDYDTPEQKIGGFKRDRPWETCMTICRQWSWKPDDTMKSLEQCVRTLLQTAGGDGNLLFNVGPMADGRIEQRQIDRLAEMGAWIGKNGAGIYASRGGPYKPGSWGASTISKDGKINLFVFQGLEKGPVVLPALAAKVVKATLVDGTDVAVKQSDAGLELSVPPARIDPIATTIQLTIEGDAMAIAPIAVSAPDPGAPGLRADVKKVTASNVYQNQHAYDAAKANDQDDASRWATDSGLHEAWIAFEFAGAKKLIGVRVKNEYPDRVTGFVLEKREGADWKPFKEGEKLGENTVLTFEAVEADSVRLRVTKASDGPSFSEIAWYTPAPGQ